MHTGEKKPQLSHTSKSAGVPQAGRELAGHGGGAGHRFNLPRSLGNQALARLLQPFTPSPEDESSESASSSLAHDSGHAFQGAAPRLILQPKLEINTPGDTYEQEADRVAERVMSMSETQVQRKCACYEGGGCEKCQNERTAHERVQTKRVETNNAGEMVAPPIVHDALRSTGQPLDSSTREFMEPRFGLDLGHVRVHTDALAGESAGSINAEAYTVGADIVMPPGNYSPDTGGGRALLAHELAHVVQQQGHGNQIQRKIKVGGTGVTTSPVFEEEIKRKCGNDPRALEIFRDMQNRKEEYRFDSWSALYDELQIRSKLIAGMQEVDNGCCRYPDEAHRGGALDSAFWVKKGPYHFEVKSPLPPGKEASDAIEAIFKPGSLTTFLECLSMEVAISYFALLKILGKEKFNKTYPQGSGIFITKGGKEYLKTPIGGVFTELQVKSVSELIPGDLVYFKNFANYWEKVDGFWAGENAIYYGNGMFRGFGVKALTEEQMLKELVEKYNKAFKLEGPEARTVEDLKKEGGGFTGWVTRPSTSRRVDR
jgi:Domain of unknown function (DUF4157)/Protein-glutamine gamma-glutamyltransferase